MSELLSQAESIAQEILSITRGQLLVNFRFLDMAMFQIHDVPSPFLPFATDGTALLYSPSYILNTYRLGRSEMLRSMFHVLMHCVYQHMFVSPDIDRPLWDLCCDIAVEGQILSLNHIALHCDGDGDRRKALHKLQQNVPKLTAERLYGHFKHGSSSEQTKENYTALFSRDVHVLWYGSGQGTEAETSEKGDGNTRSAPQNGLSAEAHAQAQAQWEKISQRMQTDLETFAKQQDTDPGDLLQSLRELHREKYDYTSFLRNFAARHEVLKLSDDEFDYVFYTYGLSLYRDMPIIEPLEYRDAWQIRDLVIAIDTSGSTSGELVQAFLQKTYNVLQQEETFQKRFNLHIIQCDADIQEDVVITTQAAFDAYIAGLTIKGLGGTDFRPVFHRVNELIAQKAFHHLKGLIYFTDGYGTFPEKKPDYETAFVFVDDDATDVEVPNWAIKLILRSDEIADRN